MEGHKPKIPRIALGIAIQSLPLGPLEGFVLSRIDALATVADIADLTSLDIDEVERIVDRLIALGAVEWADGTAHLPRMSQKSVAPPRPTTSRSSQSLRPEPRDVKEVQSARPASAAAARAALSSFTTPPRGLVRPTTSAPPPGDGIELPHDRRKRIDDLYVALDLLDHYDVLGLARRAAKADVRAAYFALSKVFHPDTAFRKNVGPYRAKMEAIFKRLTEAYDVLGKKKARDEYDAYLDAIGETRDGEKALSAEHEIPAELLAPPPSEAPPAPLPPPAMPARSTPTEEGKRVARELLAKRFGTPRHASAPSPREPEPAAPPPIERTKREALRDLASSLKSLGSQTGGVDRVTRLIAEARDAEQRRDLAGAVRAYRLAMALAPERLDLAAEHERITRELAASLADRYEQQAIYEDRHQKWGAAATNWSKVVDGRPSDKNALERAANALVEAKGDLHKARGFAQRAVDADPENLASRLTLGRVFHAAGLVLNAKRELEAAQQLDPKNVIVQKLLGDLAGRS